MKYLKVNSTINIVLGDRTEETVRIYFDQAQKPAIKAMLPQKATTVEEAIFDYRETLLPTATSYGRIILITWHLLKCWENRALIL